MAGHHHGDCSGASSAAVGYADVSDRVDHILQGVHPHGGTVCGGTDVRNGRCSVSGRIRGFAPGECGWCGGSGNIAGVLCRYREGKSDVKSTGSTRELHLKLLFLSIGEAIGIPSVAVKCVDIRRNTSGEGGLLDDN